MKFSHYLLTPLLMGCRNKPGSLHNLSDSLQQKWYLQIIWHNLSVQISEIPSWFKETVTYNTDKWQVPRLDLYGKFCWFCSVVFYILRQVPIYLSCPGKCSSTVLLWISRNVLWTIKLHPTFWVELFIYFAFTFFQVCLCWLSVSVQTQTSFFTCVISVRKNVPQTSSNTTSILANIAATIL